MSEQETTREILDRLGKDCAIRRCVRCGGAVADIDGTRRCLDCDRPEAV